MSSGTIKQKKRAKGLTWVYRYQVTRPSDGKRVEHTKVLGLVKEIGTSEAAAWREVGRLGLDINRGHFDANRVTFGELAEHFRRQDLRKETGIAARAGETVATAELVLDKWVLPRWANYRADQMKPLEIESWFETLTGPRASGTEARLSWSSVAKVKSIMGQVFRHAQRHELIPATIGPDGRPTNPVLLARSKSGSDYEAVVVSPEQMIVILKELDGRETRIEWILALLHAATALRPEEAFGLKWSDIDWSNNQIKIRRGWSKGRETSGKNKRSMTQVVMHPALAEALYEWRRESTYALDTDWVFASSKAKGRIPRAAGCAAQDYLRPAAVKAGVITDGYKGRFGWHNLRHSLATFLAANDVSLSVIQSILRHSKPSTTAVYTHRVNAAQMAAQATFLDAIKVNTAG